MNLALIILIAALIHPQIVAVDTGIVIPVHDMNGLSVPTQDDVFGEIDEYQAIVFVAHDYLAGNHIKSILDRGYVYLVYDNGTKVKYEVVSSGLVERGTKANEVYNTTGLIFQTCKGDKILIIRMDK